MSVSQGEVAVTAEEAFEMLYVGSRDRLVAQIAALSGDVAEAHDHVQEAFVAAWARWDRVGTLQDPAGWVRRCAWNRAVSRWRRGRRVILRPSNHDHEEVTT